MSKKLFCQLGRFGDIMNVLPLAMKHFFDTGEKPYFMTAEAYADILDGISYVEPIVFKGEFRDVERALFEARMLTEDIVLSQIYGNGIRSMEICTSFARESWLSAGATEPWGTLPLIFDKLDLDREKELWNTVIPDDVEGKRIVLVALDGFSSPFPHRRELMQLLHMVLRRDTFHIVDLARVRAKRIYDLLGLMNKATCLVTVDTGILHLAHASRVPVISLITSRPSRWHGSAWRPNHAFRFYYDEYPAVKLQIVDAIHEIASNRCGRRIVHTWANFRNEPPDEETQRRLSLAEETWKAECKPGIWIQAETKRSEVIRSGLDIGDACPAPFLRDVIKNGLRYAQREGDIIAITNADVSFVPGLTGLVLDTVRRYGAAFTHRWDFDRLEKPFTNEAEVKCGRWYPGSDAFFISVEWWNEHGDELPDMLMGREKNDEVFRQLIKRYGGVEITAAIYHEKHNSFWERPENFETNAGNNHNRRLAAEWAAKTGYAPDDWRWWPAVEGQWQFSIDRHTA